MPDAGKLTGCRLKQTRMIEKKQETAGLYGTKRKFCWLRTAFSSFEGS